MVWRRGLVLSWDSEEGLGQGQEEEGRGWGLRREETRTIPWVGWWLVAGTGGTVWKFATWRRSKLGKEASSAGGLMNVRGLEDAQIWGDYLGPRGSWEGLFSPIKVFLGLRVEQLSYLL